jgi:hypothetical protein
VITSHSFFNLITGVFDGVGVEVLVGVGVTVFVVVIVGVTVFVGVIVGVGVGVGVEQMTVVLVFNFVTPPNGLV